MVTVSQNLLQPTDISESDLSEGFSGRSCPSDFVWQGDMDWTEISNTLLYYIWFLFSASKYDIDNVLAKIDLAISETF